MIKVVIESPYAGQGDTPRARAANTERNLRYLRAALHDCFLRGEAPYASHALYTQPGVLDDNHPDERKLGIEAGFAWRDSAEKTVVYTDLGTTSGMQFGISDANKKGRPIEYRELGAGWDAVDRSTASWTVTAQPKDEVAWLIERTFEGRIEYWTGSHWATDSLVAARFVTKHDASTVVALCLTDGYYNWARVTEHMWCAP